MRAMLKQKLQRENTVLKLPPLPTFGTPVGKLGAKPLLRKVGEDPTEGEQQQPHSESGEDATVS